MALLAINLTPDLVAAHDLVADVEPVQFATRLLVPEGGSPSRGSVERSPPRAPFGPLTK